MDEFLKSYNKKYYLILLLKNLICLFFNFFVVVIFDDRDFVNHILDAFFADGGFKLQSLALAKLNIILTQRNRLVVDNFPNQ